jgi:hypothetical protein
MRRASPASSLRWTSGSAGSHSVAKELANIGLVNPACMSCNP